LPWRRDTSDACHICIQMSQVLLFPDDPAAQPPPQNFVFERLTALDLFEQSTAVFLHEFVDDVILREGFRGTEDGRKRLVNELSDRLLRVFLDDGEFAARIGASKDCRPELQALLGKWLREHARSQ
jgi:hypothetical protein